MYVYVCTNYYTTILNVLSMLRWEHSQEKVPVAYTPSLFCNETTPHSNHTPQCQAVHQSAAKVQAVSEKSKTLKNKHFVVLPSENTPEK